MQRVMYYRAMGNAAPVEELICPDGAKKWKMLLVQLVLWPRLRLKSPEFSNVCVGGLCS